MIGNRVQITGADGRSIGAIHVGGADARAASVILLHEIFGLDRFMLDDVARWVRLGYEVLAPSLFDRIEAGFAPSRDPAGIARGLSAAKGTPDDQAIGDIAGALPLLNPNTPTFVLGYCYGGRIAWRAACALAQLSGAVVYYGNILATIAERPCGPVLCHFGAHDEHMPVQQIVAGARAHHPDMKVHVYDDAGHAFNNTGDCPSNAAQLARSRTLAFFRTIADTPTIST